LNEIPELVTFGQVETDVQFAPAEPRESALNDVNRPQHPLRHQQRDQARQQQRHDDVLERLPQRLAQLALHQKRREADPDRADLLLIDEQHLPHFVRAVGVDGAEEGDGAPLVDDLAEVLLVGDPLPFERRGTVNDRDSFLVHDRRIDDVGRERERGFQERADPAVLLQRGIGVVRRDHDIARALIDHLLQHVAARGGLLQAQPRQRREVED
jgi:hypothetical protein